MGFPNKISIVKAIAMPRPLFHNFWETCALLQIFNPKLLLRSWTDDSFVNRMLETVKSLHYTYQRDKISIKNNFKIAISRNEDQCYQLSLDSFTGWKNSKVFRNQSHRPVFQSFVRTSRQKNWLIWKHFPITYTYTPPFQIQYVLVQLHSLLCYT